ncbi:MAG: DUF4381 domain-containing protein [Candidatus Poribacteria bacterium]|nr:DUF4381 domain-containing protein [Candidatus Poribacteria bacterium]
MEENREVSKLEGLQEIVLPVPISYTPQTIAWYILFGVVLIVVIWLGWHWYKRLAANRYRREALRVLDKIEQEAQDADKRVNALADIPGLVKQTVLAFAPREEVAAFSNASWLSFLDSTYAGSAFTSGVGQLLPQLAYQPPEALKAVSEEDVTALIALLRKWIRRHHAGI